MKFINLSDKPTSQWEEEQVIAARRMAGCEVLLDIMLPSIPPKMDEAALAQLVNQHVECIHGIAKPGDAIVHLMGGPEAIGFIYQMVARLRRDNYIVVHSTTRMVEVFERRVPQFVRFREYREGDLI